MNINEEALIDVLKALVMKVDALTIEISGVGQDNKRMLNPLVGAVDDLTEAMTELAKATDRSTDQIDRSTTLVDEVAERLEEKDDDIRYIDEDDDSWQEVVTHDSLIEQMGGDFSNTSAASLMDQVKMDTMEFSPAVLLDFGLMEPHQQDKFGAIQFVVKYCDVTVPELFRTVPLLPNTSHEALQELCTSPTHSPYYGRDLWGCGGPKTPK